MKLFDWLWRRTPATRHAVAGTSLTPAPAPGDTSASTGETTRARTAAEVLAAPTAADETPAALHRQLWRFVFRAATLAPPLDAAQQAVLNAARAQLTDGTMADRHFPRRPTLMPQLLAAVNNAAAGASTLAGIITQDPVLTADVLRLANSVFLRPGSQPIESVQRAIIVCGTDGLQSLAARALLQPVFRGGSGAAFAEFPPRLWEHSTRAGFVAGAHARLSSPAEQQTAQLLPLLAALGPLVAYRVLGEQYRAAPSLQPEPQVYLQLIETESPAATRRIVAQWGVSDRLQQALQAAETDADDARAAGDLAPLVAAQRVGSMLATLSLLRDAGQLLDSDCERIIAAIPGAPELWPQLLARAQRQ
jgi:HD-like signal output (HDOD) protein